MKQNALNLRLRPVISGVLGAIIFGLTLTGCNKENTPEAELPLDVTLTDNGFLAENGEKLGVRSFAAGDEAGLFLLRDGQAVAENVLLTYDGQAWTSEAPVKVNGSETCFIYTPYRQNASAVVDYTAANASDFFRPLFGSGKYILDQTDYDAVRRSDISFAEAATVKTDASLKVNAALDHMLSIAMWELTDGTNYRTSDGFSYNTPSNYTNVKATLDGQVVKPCGVSSYKAFYYLSTGDGAKITVSYTDAGQNKSFDVHLSGERGKASLVKAGKGAADGGKRGLAIGDLVYSDGSILPVEEAAKLEDGKAPAGVIGIIFQTDKSRISDAEKALLGNVHALVISTKMPKYNDSYDVKWFDDYPTGSDNDNRNENQEDPKYPGMTLPFIVDRDSYANSFKINDADINGYQNNVVIRTRRADDIDKWYPAFSASAKFAATAPLPPFQNSGWYLPSAGQLMDLFRTLGGADITLENASDFQGGGDFLVSIDHCGTMAANFDAAMAKVQDADKDLHSPTSNALWSSSFSWGYFTDGSISYMARQVLTYGSFSVIGYSTFGLALTRAAFSF